MAFVVPSGCLLSYASKPQSMISLFPPRRVLSSQALAGRRLSYVGLDIVQPLAEALARAFDAAYWARSAPASLTVHFAHFDVSQQMLWPADLIVMRDLLFHFPRERVLRVLRRVSHSGAKYLLTTHFTHENNSRNNDLARRYGDGLGHFSFWPINLEAKPFSLGPPLLTIGMDGEYWSRDQRVRGMGLWSLPLWSTAAAHQSEEFVR